MIELAVLIVGAFAIIFGVCAIFAVCVDEFCENPKTYAVIGVWLLYAIFVGIK